MALLTETQAAYLAGLIDGEGCLHIQRMVNDSKNPGPHFSARVTFLFATAEPLITVCGWLGLSPKMAIYPSAKGKVRYRCDLKRSMIEPVLNECLPFMILKHRQAEILLEVVRDRKKHKDYFGKFTTTDKTTIQKMEVLWKECRDLKIIKRIEEKEVPS